MHEPRNFPAPAGLLGLQVQLSEEEQTKIQDKPDKLAIGGEGGFQVARPLLTGMPPATQASQARLAATQFCLCYARFSI